MRSAGECHTMGLGACSVASSRSAVGAPREGREESPPRVLARADGSDLRAQCRGLNYASWLRLVAVRCYPCVWGHLQCRRDTPVAACSHASQVI